MDTLVTVVKEVYEWSTERINTLEYNKRTKDALAISNEFREWIQANCDDEVDVIVHERLSKDNYLNHIND